MVRKTRTVQSPLEEGVMRLSVQRLTEGGYLATSSDVPGLVAQGRTLAETVEIAQDVARRILESCLEHGDPLPPALRKSPAKAVVLSVPIGLPCSS